MKQNYKKKRKIFLGDSGSMLLGTIIMVYILFLLSENYVINEKLSLNKTLLSVLIILYPLIDLLRVFVIRIKRGLSPFIADQNHIHHKLLFPDDLICNKFLKQVFLNILSLIYLKLKNQIHRCE